MVFEGKFNDLKDDIDRYFKEHPNYLKDMHKYKLLYVNGKYLNDYFSISRELYRYVIFDDDVTYKTWWNTYPNSRYSDETLVYVEIDDSDEGKASKEKMRDIDSMIEHLSAEKAKLSRAEKQCKINEAKIDIEKLKWYIAELKNEYGVFAEAINEEKIFCQKMTEQLLEMKAKITDLNMLMQIDTLMDNIEKASANTVSKYEEVSASYMDTIKKAESVM